MPLWLWLPTLRRQRRNEQQCRYYTHTHAHTHTHTHRYQQARGCAGAGQIRAVHDHEGHGSIHFHRGFQDRTCHGAGVRACVRACVCPPGSLTHTLTAIYSPHSTHLPTTNQKSPSPARSFAPSMPTILCKRQTQLTLGDVRAFRLSNALIRFGSEPMHCLTRLTPPPNATAMAKSQ